MKYTNWPQRRRRSFYLARQREFVKLCRLEPGITSVFTAGSVSNPGISDLDFLLGINSRADSLAGFEQRLSPPLQMILAGGTILKVPQTHISRVKIIDDFPLRRIGGLPVSFKDYQGRFFEICRILDWLPERVYALRQWQQANPRDVWRALQILKSCTVSFRKLDTLLGTDDYRAFIEKVSDLRRQWFSRAHPEKHLKNSVEEAIRLGEDGLRTIADYVEDYGYISPVKKSQGISKKFFIPGGPQVVFGGRASARSLSLPTILFYFFAGQAVLTRGPITDRLRLHLGLRASSDGRIIEALHPGLAKAIGQRMAYCNTVAHFLRAHEIRRGLLKYGWLL